MKWKELIVRLKIFVWFIATDPFRQLRDISKHIFKILTSLDSRLAWSYFTLVLLAVAAHFNQKFVIMLALILILSSVLIWEWKRGHFMHVYRQKIREDMKKKMEDKKDEF